MVNLQDSLSEAFQFIMQGQFKGIVIAYHGIKDAIHGLILPYTSFFELQFQKICTEYSLNSFD